MGIQLTTVHSPSREDVRRIYQECFDDTAAQVNLFFDNIYQEQDGMLLLDEDNHPASCLTLRRMQMSFHGTEVPVAYVHGACTRRRCRGRGYMAQLMTDALALSRERGDMLCALIPATDALYFYYRKFGFSTVFYYKEQRFTAFHSFPTNITYPTVQNPTTGAIFPYFDRWQHQRPCAILHDQEDFATIIKDCELDGGTFAVVTREGENEPAAMAWGIPHDGVLLVTDALGDDADAVTGALKLLRGHNNEMPFLWYGDPGNIEGGGRLTPRGMARIVNPQLALQCIAVENPRWSSTIRVKDTIFGDTIYEVREGECRTVAEARHLDFDLNIAVLTEIIFSSTQVGSMLDFPTVRPMMSLMLD